MWLLFASLVAEAATLRVGPGQAYSNIWAAVQAAASGDVVLVDPGAYTVTRTIAVDKSLTIRGNGGVPTLDARDRAIFSVSGGTVVVEDLSLAPRGEPGVWMTGGSLTLRRVVISGNRNPNSPVGAGILMDGGLDLTLEDSTLSDNGAVGSLLDPAQGGCLAAIGGRVTLRRSHFEQCVSTYGGAVHGEGGVVLVVEDSTFVRNSASGAFASGGAILTSGELTIRGSTFDRNSASGTLLGPGDSGAVYAAAMVTIEDSRFTDNSTDEYGGAVSLGYRGVVRRTLFCDNRAGSGGGAIAVFEQVSSWELSNNIFAENEGDLGSAVLCRSDESGTSWPSGGVFRNNHVLGNASSSQDSAVQLEGARATVENNLFMSNGGQALEEGSGSLDWNAWYMNVIDLADRTYGSRDLRGRDPLLAAWSPDGDCANDDFQPRAGSPLRDAGNPAIIDRDGSPSDIGAWGGPESFVTIDDDQDGSPEGPDCDDHDAAVFPGAAELCNGVDDDCDGNIDLPTPANAPLWFPDNDGDGHGKHGPGTPACSQPPGYVASDDDCADRQPTVWLGAPELCDGIDNDCDDLIDGDDAGDLPRWYPDNDGDGYGRPIADPEQACEAPPGTVSNGDDCDDGNGQRNPVAVEVCDGIDQDCDGEIDDDPPMGLQFFPDGDGDGWGDGDGDAVTGCALPAGYAITTTDCDDDDPDVHPLASEPCEPPRDLNCDGASGTADNDGDGFGACEECDDYDSSRYPDAPDVWYDGVITDCSRLSDYDADRDGFDAAQGGGADCDDADDTIHPGAADTAGDGVDNNCDGVDAASGGSPVSGGADEEEPLKGCRGCASGGDIGLWGLWGVLLWRGRRRG
jgi:hypothetical protein